MELQEDVLRLIRNDGIFNGRRPNNCVGEIKIFRLFCTSKTVLMQSVGCLERLLEILSLPSLLMEFPGILYQPF